MVLAIEITYLLSINGEFMADIGTNELYDVNQVEEVYEEESSEIENETSDDDLEDLLADTSVDTITAYTMGSW
ncbi:hypothetical protein JYQ62_08105 [Nostoc sp. UHCC 0702]|nr:hypothetical protein JYQ62_08105 [Nostoc sp. UHCC 0702]